MPFPMTHLYVAERLLSLCSSHITGTQTAEPVTGVEAIRRSQQFVLGSIAPDGVHYRAGGFNGEDKKITHLCAYSSERWGRITDNVAWTNHVLSFMREHVEGADAAFYYGYCAHVLTDIRNNEMVWTPFRLRYPEEAAKGYGNIHHQELAPIDLKLFLALGDDSLIKTGLTHAVAVEVPGIVSAAEVEAIRHNILYEGYNGRSETDTSGNRIVTFEDVLRFIEQAAEQIAALMFS